MYIWLTFFENKIIFWDKLFLILSVAFNVCIRDDLFQLFNWFQLFSSENKIPKLRDMIWTGQKWRVCKGCRWFRLFLIDFQLFYFLTRIIPVVWSSWIKCITCNNDKTFMSSWWRMSHSCRIWLLMCNSLYGVGCWCPIHYIPIIVARKTYIHRPIIGLYFIYIVCVCF
jgi:hypothetical protein